MQYRIKSATNFIPSCIYWFLISYMFVLYKRGGEILTKFLFNKYYE